MKVKVEHGKTERQRILSTLRRRKSKLQSDYKISEIGIFGSVARGESRQRSDIDVLVDFQEVPDLITFVGIERHLTDLLDRKVDLIDKRGLRPALRDAILNEVVYV